MRYIKLPAIIVLFIVSAITFLVLNTSGAHAAEGFFKCDGDGILKAFQGTNKVQLYCGRAADGVVLSSVSLARIEEPGAHLVDIKCSSGSIATETEDVGGFDVMTFKCSERGATIRIERPPVAVPSVPDTTRCFKPAGGDLFDEINCRRMLLDMRISQTLEADKCYVKENSSATRLVKRNCSEINISTPSPGGGGGGGAGRGCTELAIKINGKTQVCGKNRLIEYVSLVVRFLTLGIGIVVVIMVIIGGIQYTSSSGDPGAVAAAKSRIFNALLALILFIFAVAILNWLVPGGIV